MHNIKLCYLGGSGGFILLHLLLLSDKFYCTFKDKNNGLQDIINKQWNVTNHLYWKQAENWPDNWLTQKNIVDRQKIYFFCNPTIEKISAFDGKIVLLYTDSKSHLELAYYKRAWIYEKLKNYSKFAYYKSFLRAWQDHYNNIKSSEWPMCYGPKKLEHVDQYIQQEVLSNPYTGQHLKFPSYSEFLKDTRMIPGLNQFTDNVKKLPNNVEVFQPVADFFQHADITFRLQDVINDISVLSVVTNSLPNQQQYDLRNKWMSLHTPELLDTIGIIT
jgi:hypothetical protein